MNRWWAHARRPPWRTLYAFSAVGLLCGLVYLLWQPGKWFEDGRHDRGTNALWIGHGWMGDDVWFDMHRRERSLFRAAGPIASLRDLCATNHIDTVYPHVCPCHYDGSIAAVDDAQTERLLAGLKGIRVIPWLGGVNGKQVDLTSNAWQSNFVQSAMALLNDHPGFAGIQINIEPLPSGDRDFIRLIRSLREELPDDKALSVAGYPPPTRWHPHPDVHWEEAYVREVAGVVDEIAFMMYDAGQRAPKLYQGLMKKWTRECLAWAGDCEVLLGVPTYDDEGVGYHHPRVENMEHALRGIHGGLNAMAPLPANYRGLAIYCGWETDSEEWALWRKGFTR